MTDEQRPWREYPEYVTLGIAMQKAHEYDSPSFLRADVDVALDALCARVGRYAAEAQRDRLAAALDEAAEHMEHHCESRHTVGCTGATFARAALADVREAESATGEVGAERTRADAAEARAAVLEEALEEVEQIARLKLAQVRAALAGSGEA